MQGTFGQVVKCSKISNSEPVMIKMFKKDPQYILAAQTEVNILNKLKRQDSEKSHMVKWYQAFEDRAFTCLLFEHMESSLLDRMKERHPDGLDLKTIRFIIKQVALALYYGKYKNIIHGDLKLENVLLVNHTAQPWTVKLFGFSQAHEVSEAHPGRSIQRCLPYRSPEITLGLPYDGAVDVWSLGCITAALYVGEHLYPGKSPYEMLKYMTQTQGQLPDTMLNEGLDTNRFFLRDDSTGSWKLKLADPSHHEDFQETDLPLKDNGTKVLSSLQDFLKLKPLDSQSRVDEEDEIGDRRMFVGLLESMLQLDAAKRLTPHKVVQHEFLRM
ncbi:homeodomain-interacting protein kinase 1-like [Salarias fasciatus]|uniref:homeodomain-interacting protein kinase 1-like n=1 Tax=Salarias fasciatus TaxID=181472 RepID=UPI001176A0EB|nr:homeodomain-interacting protein kinase 1-like [Salarias fasciatus]